MANLNDLHIIRQTKGSIRQHKHTPVLNDLEVRMRPLDNPYDSTKIDRSFFDRLGKVASFSSGSIGYQTRISGCDYIYRITTAYKLAKVLEETAAWKLSISPSLEVDETLFNAAFESEFRGRTDWIPLHPHCAAGTLKYKRNFSFWTCDEYDCSNLLRESFKAGLASDWFDERVMVLRCRVSDIEPEEIRVPTVIDAFDQPIFHPRKDNSLLPPTHGIAIDIEPVKLVRGKREFVVGEIPTRLIDFKIRRLKKNATDGINFLANTGGLWDKLESYYQTL